MQPTLRFRTVVPAPFTAFTRLCTVRTTDAVIAFGLQGVEGQEVVFDVGLTLLASDI